MGQEKEEGEESDSGGGEGRGEGLSVPFSVTKERGTGGHEALLLLTEEETKGREGGEERSVSLITFSSSTFSSSVGLDSSRISGDSDMEESDMLIVDERLLE